MFGGDAAAEEREQEPEQERRWFPPLLLLLVRAAAAAPPTVACPSVRRIRRRRTRESLANASPFFFPKKEVCLPSLPAPLHSTSLSPSLLPRHDGDGQEASSFFPLSIYLSLRYLACILKGKKPVLIPSPVHSLFLFLSLSQNRKKKLVQTATASDSASGSFHPFSTSFPP